MGSALTLLRTPSDTLQLPFSSSRGHAWIVTRRSQPFSVPTTRKLRAREMYRRARRVQAARREVATLGRRREQRLDLNGRER